MSTNYQVSTPEKGWNDAPVVVMKQKDNQGITHQQLYDLVKSEPSLTDLHALLKNKTLDPMAVSLIYNYWTTGTKSYYQKLVAGYYSQYTWIPLLKKAVQK